MKAPAIFERAKKYASYRKVLYEKKANAVEQILWQEPDGRVHLQILFKQFARPILKDYPCRYIGNGRYKCENLTIDTQKQKTYAKITLSDAVKESPVIYSSLNFLKDTALKTIIIGVITGLTVYTITKLIDKSLKEARA